MMMSAISLLRADAAAICARGCAMRAQRVALLLIIYGAMPCTPGTRGRRSIGAARKRNA